MRGDETTKIITKSGRIVTLRLPPMADTAEKINSISFIRNIRKSWYKCQKVAKQNEMSNSELGFLFYQALEELFGNYDDIIIVEDE